MDTSNGTIGSEGTRIDTTVPAARPLQRVLLFGALICFALPFLTVTCYGSEATVSGVQAATSIDLSPGGGGAERQLIREEQANGFAFLALTATAAGIVLALRMRDTLRITAWAAACGVFALHGFFLYAAYRSWAEAIPRIGYVGAMLLLTGAAWVATAPVPRWVIGSLVGLAVVMIPTSLLPIELLYQTADAYLYLPLLLGGFIAVALVVGATRATTPPSRSVSAPIVVRALVAGIVGLLIVTAVVVGAFVLMGMRTSDLSGPDTITGSYWFASVVLAANVAAGFGAWAAGTAIARPRRVLPAPAEPATYPVP